MRKRRKRSSFTILIALVLLLLLIGCVYITKNPTVFDKIPNVKGKLSEPTASPTITTPARKINLKNAREFNSFQRIFARNIRE